MKTKRLEPFSFDKIITNLAIGMYYTYLNFIYHYSALPGISSSTLKTSDSTKTEHLISAAPQVIFAPFLLRQMLAFLYEI